jgi:hypothetical protein
MNITNEVETINGELDNRFNQSIDWFLNSEYYTANIPLKFFFATSEVNMLNKIRTEGVSWKTVLPTLLGGGLVLAT